MTHSLSYTRDQRKVLFLSSLGGALEYYDFIIYIFFTHIIEKNFFSQPGSSFATLKTLAVFSIGYLLRPIGGVIFSHFGDRYGRKVVFILTVVCMAVPSMAIGLLPTTAQIGGWAPLLLLLFRMLQGLALGGEIPAAITFVAEHMDNYRKGFSLSTLFVGINLGMLLASGATSILSFVFTETELMDYGWRVAFIVGGLFGFVSLWFRRSLQETTAFRSLKLQELKKVPFLYLMRHFPKQVFQGTFLVAIAAVCVFIFLYWPEYLHQYFHYDYSWLIRMNTLSTFILSFMILIGGLLVDQYGGRKVYLWGVGTLACSSYWIFHLLLIPNPWWTMVPYFMLSAIFCLLPAAYSMILTQMFPTSVRYSGVAMSYNLAYAFFGGTSPLISEFIIQYSHQKLAPSLYITIIAVISWCVCFAQAKKLNSND